MHAHPDYVTIGLSALAAGAVNAVAGGGTLISFPVMTAFGMSPVPFLILSASALLAVQDRVRAWVLRRGDKPFGGSSEVARAAAPVGLAAAVFFAFSGRVVWDVALVMSIGALVGGSMGGRFASRVSPSALRRVVVAIGFVVGVTYLVN